MKRRQPRAHRPRPRRRPRDRPRAGPRAGAAADLRDRDRDHQPEPVGHGHAEQLRDRSRPEGLRGVRGRHPPGAEPVHAREPADLDGRDDRLLGVDGREAGRRRSRRPIRFVKTLRPQDLAQVVQFNDRATTLQAFTSDHAALEAAIRKTEASGSTALRNALYIALKDLMRDRKAAELRRRAIVLLSDGEDTASLVSDDQVLELARKSEINIYTISLRKNALRDRDDSPSARPTTCSRPSRATPAAAATSRPRSASSTPSTTGSPRSCARSTASATSPRTRGATASGAGSWSASPTARAYDPPQDRLLRAGLVAARRLASGVWGAVVPCPRRGAGGRSPPGRRTQVPGPSSSGSALERRFPRRSSRACVGRSPITSQRNRKSRLEEKRGDGPKPATPSSDQAVGRSRPRDRD